MTKIRFEYSWLDGHTPIPNLRSKTKILDLDAYNGALETLPVWSFDGSSTKQAEGHASDCILKPVKVYLDTTRKDAYLVLSEVYNADGTPHTSNRRNVIDKHQSEDFWIGFEQEYVFMSREKKPIGFPSGGYPEPQGPYYCAVGSERIAGRKLVEEHLNLCLEAGINITGINAEVMLGQWEYQCFAKNALDAADDLIVSRYLLYRIAEKYDFIVNLHPKPIKGDWNGSGMHTNFSNSQLRDVGGEEYIKRIMFAFEKSHKEHMEEYGAYNEERLTGLHETQSINTFSYGVSDRGSSIRIPLYTKEHGWKGYLEDRRPSSNADPYRVVKVIMKTVSLAQEPAGINPVSSF